MRKQIFLAICARLSDQVPDVRFIDLWNNNVQPLNGGATFPLPAVFVEFETIEWRQQNTGARRGDVAVRLHIVTRSMPTHGHTDPNLDASLAFLDLIERIGTAMRGLRGEGFGTFQLTSSATNHDHAELVESVERYVTSAQSTADVPATSIAEGLAAALRQS